ncbi:hypothetical protein [Streptococcus parauberis]|uniref:hypothetical protein n=1 Tax=Streptococcus parauberis TaxID=1348 RepID=UPI000CCF246E|nr:hypothetical protein [Streptococcus parauberis]PNY19783.1 hypothetical protein ASN86_00608 [Streptococcus parauberis]
MKESKAKRYYIGFLSGPTRISHLHLAWINLVFSLLFYWITTTYFQTPKFSLFLILSALYSFFCAIYSLMKKLTYHYKQLSLWLVLSQIILLLFNLDFMGLLMFLSPFQNDKLLSFQNLPFTVYMSLILVVLLISLACFANHYRQAKQEQKEASTKSKLSFAQSGAIIFGIVTSLGGLVTGGVASLFGIVLGISLTILFAALIIDSIYTIKWQKENPSAEL